MESEAPAVVARKTTSCQLFWKADLLERHAYRLGGAAACRRGLEARARVCSKSGR
jgi:hypothetical protein